MGVTVTTGICVLMLVSMVEYGQSAGYDYTPSKNEKTEVEIQKVEVYEMPWIGDQQPQNSYSPPNPQYGPPSQEYGPPSQEYGPPSQEYGPPSQEYGPPSTVYPDLTTTISPLNITNSTETADNTTILENAKLQSTNGVTSKGHYYIYHPGGLLQKVVYSTKDDAENMAFSAQLKYKNVDPVRGPIYTYDPDTYVFSRLNRK
ncbi:pollen-specific leucine-rich repeat extensin-like protein 2 [Sitophilus oryzae]|uniref:Pollen-specific leucine-rich repeat extensin-like protein 2 n=1 Tax=Sitophilus oryzae TaxID=7048 RepID=A0A6J2YGP5_SITOR|nr:pollen-specific leucine-rich repeat extensin-like protein 2 [Sitophilus oryzae]